MERSVAVVVLVVAVALAAVPSGGLAQSESASVAPGERFAGVVGVQGAELEGEVAIRAFGVRFARADSDAARAAVVAEQLTDARERLDELERRRERLRAARANGTISEGQYRARVARLAAESRTLQQRLDRTADASREVPDAALRERGVEPAELDRLRRAVGNLTGPEVAAISRGIAGSGPPAGTPSDRPSDAGNASDRGSPESTPNASDSGSAAGSPDRAAGSDGNGTAEGAPDRSGEGSADGDRPSDGGSDTAENESTDSSSSDDPAEGEPSDSGSRNESDDGQSGSGADGSPPADGGDGS